MRPHLPLPPPLETSRLLIHHCTTAHSVPALSTAPDLLHWYSRQPPRICSGSFVLPTRDASSTPPGAAPPTPPSTASDPLRRHLPQPYRSRFADTIVNPTGVASPIPFSILPGPLCQLTSPWPQIRIVDTTLNPTTGAASDAPSTAADPHRRHILNPTTGSASNAPSTAADPRRRQHP